MRNTDLNYNEEYAKIFDSLFLENKKETSLFANYDYIDWLVKFTSKYPNFTTEDFDYETTVISEHDKEMVSNLGLFFNKLESHAKKNYIKLGLDRESYAIASEYIVVKYKDLYFRIGCSRMQFVCIVSRVNEATEYLDFELIMNDQITKRASEIKTKLTRFNKLMDNHIERMLKEGVPFQSVSEEAKKVLTRHDRRYK